MTNFIDPCAHCEEMMQPYLDHVLTEEERVEAESHLDEYETCRRRYRFDRRWHRRRHVEHRVSV